MNRNVGGFSNCRRFRTFLTLSMGMTRVFIASQNSDTDFVDAIGCLRHAGTLLITADLGDATALMMCLHSDNIVHRISFTTVSLSYRNKQ